MTYDGITDLSLTNGSPHGNLCDQARAFVTAGIPVFPVFNTVENISGLRQTSEDREDWVCSCGKSATEPGHKPGKHPAVPRGHHDAKLLSDEEIAGWFFDGSKGLAFPTGNGIIVIDVDPKNGGDETLDAWEEWTHGVSLPTTLTVRTGSGGLHLIYRLPLGVTVPKRDGILPGIDLKSDGGYCVAAGSRHSNGELYTWRNPGHPIAVVPADLLNWLLTQRGGMTGGGGGGGGGLGRGEGRPDDYDFTQGGTAGQRDTYANDQAFRLRKAGVSWERAVESMRTMWDGMEQPSGDYFPWETTLEKLERVWRTVQPDVADDLREAAQRMLDGRRTGVEQTDTESENEPLGGAEGGSPRPEVLEGEVVDGTGAGSRHGGGGEGGGRGDGRAATLEERATDTGNAVRYARLLHNEVRYIPQEDQWYVWDGSRLKADTLNVALGLTRRVIDDLREQALTEPDQAARDRWTQWALQSESIGKRKAMLEAAELEPGIALSVDILDRDPMLLVVENGTLDLHDGLLRRSRVNDFCTKKAATYFDVDAECPLWLKHIDTVTAGNARLAAYLQRACGYSLTGLVSEQQFFFLWGTGQNGKNVFTETVLGLLGEYGQVAPPGLITGGEGDHPTTLAGLRGARMVMADETAQGRRINDARIKMLTGSGKISARFMGKDFFEYDSTMKLWILGNAKPAIKDTSNGMWRRMHLAPFTATIPDGRRILRYEEQLKAEWSGILNWCLTGLKDWQSLGGLGSPQEVKDAVQDYRDEEDLIGQFLTDRTKKCSGDGSPMPEIFAAYLAWCFNMGIKQNDIMNAVQLGKELTARGYGRVIKKIMGKATRVVIGVELDTTLSA